MRKTNTMHFANAVLALLLLLTLTISFCQALDMEGAKEQQCFKIDKTVPMDLNWIMSIKTWYWPLMTRYDLYKGAIDLLKRNPKEILEDEVYYDSCITWKMGENYFSTNGFNGQQCKYDATPTGLGLEGYEFSKEGGNSGTCYTTLTDNKTFTLAACCLTENQMVWGVASTHKTLPTETVELIHDHAVSLGFKREFFTGLRYYDSCKVEEDMEDSVCNNSKVNVNDKKCDYK